MNEFTINMMTSIVNIIGLFLTVNIAHDQKVGTQSIMIILLVLITDVLYVQQRQFVKLS